MEEPGKSIRQQMAELQKKEKKIQAFQKLIVVAKDLKKDSEVSEVMEDVLGELEDFVSLKTQEIEFGEPSRDVRRVEKPQLDAETINILSSLATRIKEQSYKREESKMESKPQNNKQNPQPHDPGAAFDDGNTTPVNPLPDKTINVKDKVKFAQDNRDLEKKRVSYINKDGLEVFGEVVGLAAPNIMIKLDEGTVYHVPRSVLRIHK